MRCAAAERVCARMLNIWYLDAYCIPGVHDSSCLIPERSWLANAPWRPRKGALIPAALWSSPRKSCRAGCRQPAASDAAADTA